MAGAATDVARYAQAHRMWRSGLAPLFAGRPLVSHAGQPTRIPRAGPPKNQHHRTMKKPMVTASFALCQPIVPTRFERHQALCRIATRRRRDVLLAAAGVFFVALAQAFGDPSQPFLPTPPENISAVPSNGDVNPYGVAFVPRDFNNAGGPLQPGDILVSNFNNSSNLQGTGTTIVNVPVTGSVTTFFTSPSTPPGGPGHGLSTALAVLRKGIVLVGSVPSADGTAATASAGSLLVIDNKGNLLSMISDATINGPWDMTVIDRGDRASAFVSNVFSGTVVRLDLLVRSNGVTVSKKTIIASGYQHRPDSVAFAVGPTGLVYDSEGDVLYVASTEDNAVFAIQGAAGTNKNQGKGKLIYSDATHLHGPLGMAQAPNRHLLVANSDVINSDPNQPSEIVEFTKQGQFIKQLSVDPAQGGSFGLAVAVEPKQQSVTFAAVDDNSASLIIWTLPLESD
jgi:hypothetical protein